MFRRNLRTIRCTVAVFFLMLACQAGYNGFGVISSTQSTPRYLVVAGYLRF